GVGGTAIESKRKGGSEGTAELGPPGLRSRDRDEAASDDGRGGGGGDLGRGAGAGAGGSRRELLRAGRALAAGDADGVAGKAGIQGRGVAEVGIREPDSSRTVEANRRGDAIRRRTDCSADDSGTT